MTCIACDQDLTTREEEDNGYCNVCQKFIRQTFDKDAYTLGYKQSLYGRRAGLSDLGWTNLEGGDDDERY